MIVWLLIVTGAFIYAALNNYFSFALDENFVVLIMPFLVVFSLINSLKYFDIMPLLIKYSKSGISNKTILIRLFFKKAFLINIILLIFIFATAVTLNKPVYILLFILIFTLSVSLSFFVMYFKYLFLNKPVKKDNIKKKSINPMIKSALQEFLTPDFIVLAILGISLFVIVFIELIFNNHFLKMEARYFIYAVTAVSIGLAGVVDSISNINWMFHAIIFKNDFKYHIKRTLIFLAGIFGSLILFFIISGIFINIELFIKYFFCLCAILIVTINIAFTKSNLLIKFIIISINTVLTLWISVLHSGFLLLLIIPAVIFFIKAKSEYREWTYL